MGNKIRNQMVIDLIQYCMPYITLRTVCNAQYLLHSNYKGGHIDHALSNVHALGKVNADLYS